MAYKRERLQKSKVNGYAQTVKKITLTPHPMKNSNVKVDPKEIQKKMPKTWQELELFKKEIDEVIEKVQVADNLIKLPGMHPLLRTLIHFLMEFKYIKGEKEELEYFRKQITKELTEVREQNIIKLTENKFQQLYMEEVQRKVDLDKAMHDKRVLEGKESLTPEEEAALTNCNKIIANQGNDAKDTK